jgi:signal transduction histidine kinase/ActR/RegA family two-component response regulator
MRISINTVFAGVLALLLVNFFVQRHFIAGLESEQQRLAELQGLRIDVQALLATYLDAETGQRGYLLTGNDTYLEPYREAVAKLVDSDVESSGSLAPRSFLRELRARMRSLEAAKLTELAEVLRLEREEGREAAVALINTNAGRESMAKLRAELVSADEELAAKSRDVLQQTAARRALNDWLRIASAGLLVLGVSFLFFLVRRYVRQRDRSFEQAAAARTELQKSLASERAAHSEVAHANQLKDEFLSVVSHELRTPLNAILGWTSLLRQGVDDEKELGEGLETIDRNARAQAHLIDDLLDVSRIITGKVRLQIRQVDLRVVLVGVADGLRPTAKARGVELVATSTADSCWVLGDVDRLQQVVWNLLANAIKFAEKQGRVEAALEVAGSNVVLVVADDGPGISEEFLPRIFERFSQQDSGSARGKSGLGLGLAITRHLVELHGGSISADNRGDRFGAKFRVEIPVLAVRDLQRSNGVFEGDQFSVPVLPPATEKVKRSNLALAGARLLVVDDQRDTTMVMTRVLSRGGAEVRVADCVAGAMRILDEDGWRPDGVLSDIGMPDEDGYSFIRRVRDHPEESVRSLRAIAITAFARERDRDQAIQAGFNDHLAKPVDSVALVRKVAELLGK